MKDIFFCLCGHGTSQHSVVWLSVPCDVCECAQYRANRCLCHLTRRDGTPVTCYVEIHGNGDVVGHAGKQVGDTTWVATDKTLIPENSLNTENSVSDERSRILVSDERPSPSRVVPAVIETAGSNPAHSQPFWKQLAAARDAKILAEAGPDPGPGYVLRADNNGRYSYEAPHRAHKRLRGLSARYRVCQECGDSLLAWMAARSGNVHIQQRAADWIRDNNVPGYEWLIDRHYPEVTK